MITKQLLIEFNLHYDFEDAKEDLISKGIPLADELDYYVASGGYGDVYKVRGKNKVLKIHQAQEEFETTQKIIDSGKKFDHVCKYYFNGWWKPYYVVVMEFLSQPPINLDRNIGRFVGNFSHMTTFDVNSVEVVESEKGIINNMAFMEKDIIKKDLKTIKQLFDDEFYNYFIKAIWKFSMSFGRTAGYAIIEEIINNKENQKFFKDIFKGINELKSIGVINDDLHEGNILYDPKTKNYKIIDPMS